MGDTISAEQHFRRLFDRHHRDVYAYCRRRTDAASAADCLAETFLVAWRRLEDVPDGDAALGWLYAVARKTMANEFRRTRRSNRLITRLRSNDPLRDSTPEVMVVQRERDRTLLAALDSLRPEDQEVLRLAWWEELPHQQIAALLGCSPNAVTHRIQRAARRVAKEYERLDHRHPKVGAHRQQQGGEMP